LLVTPYAYCSQYPMFLAIRLDVGAIGMLIVLLGALAPFSYRETYRVMSSYREHKQPLRGIDMTLRAVNSSLPR
jgi:hypothetical protein